MASLVSTSKLNSTTSNVLQTLTGALTVVSAYSDLSKFEEFRVTAAVAALTGAGMTKLEIVAADDASGTNLTVVKEVTDTFDTVDDQATLSCLAEELAQLSSVNSTNLRYVAARVTLANIADVAVANLELSGASYAVDGLTPATTIA